MKTWFTALLFTCQSLLAASFGSLMGTAQSAMDDGLWDVAVLRLTMAADAPDAPAERQKEIQLMLAESLIRGNRPSEAIAVLGQSVLRDSVETPFWMGQALAGSGRYREAVETLLPIAADPSHPLRAEAALTAANLQLSLAQPDEALGTLSLLAESPDAGLSVVSRLRRVAILLDLGRVAEAREMFPKAENLPESMKHQANLIGGFLLLAEGNAKDAQPLFEALLADPQGQDAEAFNLAVIGNADAISMQGDPAAAMESMFAFIESRPDTSQLAPMFRRIATWLPESIPGADSPILTRLAGWLPKTPPDAGGFINTAPDTAAAAWPHPQAELTDLEAFALFTRALALRRVDSPSTKAEADILLRHLRLLAPQHFLTPKSLLTLAKWKLDDGLSGDAFAILEILGKTAKSPIIKGQAAFLNAEAAYAQGDHALATTLFAEAAETLDETGREAASFNSALARIGGDPSAVLTIQNLEPAAKQRIETDLALEKALLEDSPEDAKAGLEIFLRDNPDHPRVAEARLAIAEAAMATIPPDFSLAKAQVDTLAATGESLPPQQASRLAITRLRLLDVMGKTEEAITLATEVSTTYPGSPTSSEALLILGKNLFRSGQYNEARLNLEKLATSEPGTQRAQAALLLAARSASLGATAQSREEALALFDRTMQAAGSLNALARLEKARLLVDLNRLPDAIELLRDAYAKTPPDDPSRLSTGLLLAEAIYARGDSDPASLSGALEIYDSLANLTSGNPASHFRLQYLRGLTLEKLPDPNDPTKTRLAEARDAYYSVLDRPTDPPPPEWEWFERCGFRLFSLLEAESDWKAAITIAEKIASFAGPRSGEAATRARQLRLKHMIWED